MYTLNKKNHLQHIALMHTDISKVNNGDYVMMYCFLLSYTPVSPLLPGSGSRSDKKKHTIIVKMIIS